MTSFSRGQRWRHVAITGLAVYVAMLGWRARQVALDHHSYWAEQGTAVRRARAQILSQDLGVRASKAVSSAKHGSLLEHLRAIQGNSGVQLDELECNDWAERPRWHVTLLGEWGAQLAALRDLERLTDPFQLEEIRLVPQAGSEGLLRSELVISQAVPVLDSASGAEVRLPNGSARTYSYP